MKNLTGTFSVEKTSPETSDHFEWTVSLLTGGAEYTGKVALSGSDAMEPLVMEAVSGAFQRLIREAIGGE
jgi:hypothetical protein